MVPTNQELTSITVLSQGPNRVRVSLLSPEDVNRSAFRNVVFSSYVEFPTMDGVHKSSDSGCYTPTSEHFRTSYGES
jgi:hypothetical protein